MPKDGTTLNKGLEQVEAEQPEALVTVTKGRPDVTTVPPVLLPHAARMEPGLCHCHDTGFTVAWWEGFACRKKRIINVFNTGLRSDHKWSLKLVSKSVSYVHLERAIAVQKGNSQKLAHVALFTSCHPVLPANLMIESTPCHQHAKKFSYSLIL